MPIRKMDFVLKFFESAVYYRNGEKCYRLSRVCKGGQSETQTLQTADNADCADFSQSYTAEYYFKFFSTI